MALLIEPFSLSFEYFGSGPGQGGISCLEVVRASGDSYAVRDVSDITDDPSSTTDQLCIVADKADWRGIVQSLRNSEARCYYTEGDIDDPWLPWPHAINVDGTRTAAVELIACAWAGPPFLDIACALCEASDEQLVALSRTSGGLAARSFLWRMTRLFRVLDEYGNGRDGMSEIVRKLRDKPLTTENLWKGVKLFARLSEAERQTASAKEAFAISPFAEDIDTLVSIWRERNPARTTNERMGRGIQARDIRLFLKRFVSENATLPTGTHTIPKSDYRENMRNAASFSVDFEQLVSELRSRSA